MIQVVSDIKRCMALDGYSLLRSRALKLVLLLPTLAVVVRVMSARWLFSDDNEVVSGYGFLVDAWSTGFIVLYPVLAGVSAYSFAFERDCGAARHYLIRSAGRVSALFAKFLNLVILGLSALVLCSTVSILMTSMFWDFLAVVEDGFELIGVDEIHFELRQGFLLALVTLPAVIGLGLLCSVLTNSAMQAVATTLGVSVVVDVFKTQLGDMGRWFFSFYQPALIDTSYLGEVAKIVRGYSDVLVSDQHILMNWWIPPVQAVFLMCVACLVIRRKRM
ncbi:hypothetical protein [Aurantivibrio plasticivorans]